MKLSIPTIQHMSKVYNDMHMIILHIDQHFDTQLYPYDDDDPDKINTESI
jgi:arginase family enzyme